MSSHSLAEMIGKLYPGSISNGSCVVADNGSGPFIEKWDAAKIGAAQPTPEAVIAGFDASPTFGLAAQLADLVADRCALVDTAAIAKRAEGAAFNGKTVQIRVPIGDRPPEDISFIASSALAASIAKAASQPFSLAFTMADNSTVTLNADQMIALASAAMARVQVIHDAAATAKAAIRAAGNVAVTDQANFDTASAAVIAVPATLSV